MAETRPGIRELFVQPQKRLEVSFHTSSIDKFLQARLVLQRFGLFLKHFPGSLDPYVEDYSLGRARLLGRAIEETKQRLGVNSLFFVEDTSLRIDALSDTSDFPGLEVKEWFARTSFDQLDTELRRHGDNRCATVFSDIALHVPGLSRPVFVAGETVGVVAETPPDFPPSEQYPWLTPHTFNGWFIPQGATRRLGEMSFEESWEFDFRTKSLSNLVDRLEEYAAMLNLDTHSYSVKRSRSSSIEPMLFADDTSLLIVIGKMCAGKTTFGHHISSRHHWCVIEASDIMRLLAEKAGIQAPTSFYTARELINQKGPDIIARHIVSSYGDDLKHLHVVTGFRTIEEVEFIRREIPGCKVVHVKASERTRFERYLRRGRLAGGPTLRDFQNHDKEQWQFGLLPVADELADIQIENEGTIAVYGVQIEAVAKGSPRSTVGVSGVKKTRGSIQISRIYRLLDALDRNPGPQSCPDIAAATEGDQAARSDQRIERISQRHVNWVLRSIPELARRVDVTGDRVRYELLPAGKAYLHAVRSMAE